MIYINNKISIDKNKITFKAIKSTGPGGQNINKVSTAVLLKYNLNNQDYPQWFITQLLKKAGSIYTKNGYLLIKANSFRSQERNKKDAINRLEKLFELSSHQPKYRIKTKPRKSAIEKRLKIKKKKSRIKKLRRSPNMDE